MELIPIHKLFDIKYGNSLALTNLEQCKRSNSNSINFVSRTEKNNGVSTFVLKVEGVKPNPANTITVSVSGSVLATFLQPEPYYTGFHVLVLIPKKEMRTDELLFYTMCIRKNKYKYNYGRQANKTLKYIMVPSKIPDNFKDIDLKKLNTLNRESILKDDIDLNTEDWKWFYINRIFELEKCKCYSATQLLENGNDIYYIGAKKNDNGIMQRVRCVEELISTGNCITFIGDGQGSVGYTTYQPIDFIGSTTLTCGYNYKLNKYNALFLIAVLDLERFKYSFGRKYGKTQLLKTKIKLPSKDGQPDWEFMEIYIKSLPYSSSI